MKECSEADKRQAKRLLQEAFDNLDACLKEAQSQGKIFFNKEHTHMVVDPYLHNKRMYGAGAVEGEAPWGLQVPSEFAGDGVEYNDTIIPDEYLRQWQSTFLIRHPALSAPSYFRAVAHSRPHLSQDEVLILTKFAMDLKRIRRLFDWFESDAGTLPPVLLDADDVIRQPEVVRRYCQMVGLDPTKVRFTWTAGEEIDNNLVRATFMRTLKESSGVIMEKAPDVVDIEHECQKWKEEFGEEMGRELQNLVEEVVPDYEYLKAKRLRV
ncbi:hypothetical protein ARAM_006060 [Aspergillus rambellii]|uniref:Uncharacterized protein n=1 Tax=Aspergillus rambellii TaxID=308745 RepID=A0A0F8V594_9EURO|nr:hypothetical protein ARAM_006060 [Aspergillus rambellii]